MSSSTRFVIWPRNPARSCDSGSDMSHKRRVDKDVRRVMDSSTSRARNAAEEADLQATSPDGLENQPVLSDVMGP
eukprot:scaffold247050_cov40-Prasinocladus_malaysianus.AAC.1